MAHSGRGAQVRWKFLLDLEWDLSRRESGDTWIKMADDFSWTFQSRSLWWRVRSTSRRASIRRDSRHMCGAIWCLERRSAQVICTNPFKLPLL